MSDVWVLYSLAFSILYSLPNLFLLSNNINNGLEDYQTYADKLGGLVVLPTFDVYLAISFIVHAYLALSSAYVKFTIRRSLDIMSCSGAIIKLFFVILHLLDFRFNDTLNYLKLALPLEMQRRYY